MITRATNLFVVEGRVYQSHASPAGVFVRRRIEIDLPSGVISSVEPPRGTGDVVLEDEYLVLPGMIDVHVHAREDTTQADAYKETFATAGQAAIHGGVTAFADMPNNPAPPVDDTAYAAKRELARSCPVDVLLYAALGPRTRPLSFRVPYKAYMGPSVGELFFDGAESLRNALARYRGQLVAFHAESPEVLRLHAERSTHEERRPPEAEIEAIRLLVELAENYSLEPHICHLSTAAGLELVREARARGLPVTCEVTPHHLYYDLDNAANYPHPEFLQCNPPLRSRLDRIALLSALRAGDIDCLASDHAPHTVEEKEEGVSGLTHLDTFAPFAFWLREEGFGWPEIVRACCEAPGQLLGRFLPDRYGKIVPGYVGSLTVLREGDGPIRRSDLRTGARWSPFEGCSFGGRVTHTVVRGHVYPHEP